MPSPTALVNHSTPTDQRSVVEGFVSTVRPAPTKFTEGVFVIVPEHSTTVPIGPCEWGAIHGTAMPAQGALCLVAYGESEIPRVVWWAGAQKEKLAPSGPAAQVERAINTEFEPSATKDALVLLQINSKPAEVETTLSLKVGGVQVGTVIFPKLAEASVQTVTLPVPTAKKWEAKVTAGAVVALNSSYTFLD